MDFSQLLCVFSKISLARRISHSVSASIAKCWGGLNSQSMAVVVMKASDDSHYCNTYFGGNPNLPIVCQVTPVVTTLEVQYNENGLGNVSRILNRTLLPDDSGRSPRFKVSWFGQCIFSLKDHIPIHWPMTSTCTLAVTSQQSW